MGLKKDLLLLSSYFLILSTVLQAQDAFVYYYDFQFTPEKSTIKQNRGKILIALAIFAIINYFTLVLAPYFNCSIRKLVLISCAILIIKYGCELATYTKIMKFIFQLGALFADIIGTALFYLTTLRIVQVICDKHELKQRTGLLFGISAAIYSLSILVGSAIGYAFYQNTPTWLFLIFLATMTLVSACIAYCLLQSTDLPQEPRRQESNQQNDQNNQNQQNNEGRIEGFDAFRNNLNIGRIISFTFKTYSTIFPLFTTQTMLGVLFAYGYSLLQYLIWTSQTEQESDKLVHHKNTMLLYSFGGIVTSCIVGFICDKFTLRKLGYGLLIYNGLSMAFLYFAIYIKYYYTTLLLFMFLGMTQFALLTWLLSVCSRLYKGIFQVFAANAQVIAVAVSSYGMGVIFFEERISPGVKLSIQLAGLLIINIFSFFFIRKLPSETVVIDYLVEEQDGDSSQPNRDRQVSEIRRENPAQIQMAHRKVQKSLEAERTIDPQDLL